MAHTSSLEIPWLQTNVEVWVDNSDSMKDEDVFIRGKIISLDHDTQKANLILFHTNETRLISFSKLSQINQTSGEGFDDMVDMENLNEAELLENIRKRYSMDKIFTFVGPTLIIVNPYKNIESVVSKNILEIHQKSLLEKANSLKNMGPHVYSITSAAFKQLVDSGKNQAIIISGESGAGKTENTKFAMKFITSLGQYANMRISSSDKDNVGIEDKILSCNPILEAFGNSKTVRNDNSSRFGKLVLLLIEEKNQSTKGAVLTNYLLEKSRIINQTKGERCYHIFYHLLKSQSKQLLNSLGLDSPKKYEYLNKSGCYEIPNMNDEEAFKDILKAFKIMNFTENEILTLWKILASILHLGNLDLNEKTFDGQNNNPCQFLQEDIFDRIVELLSVDKGKLKEAFLYKFRKINQTVYKTALQKHDCISLRDSFAKSIYEMLFNYLIRRLNFAIGTPQYQDKSLEKVMKDKSRFSIGLLDIFGFEVFTKNWFEQFCINFANEKLHQLYISYVFKAELTQFINEGLEDFLAQLTFQDNQALIDVFEILPMGIFHLLDESSAIQSKDEALLGNMTKIYKSSPFFKITKGSTDSFTIVHTAKEVEYCINGFRLKNKDEVSMEIQTIMLESSNKNVADIYLVEEGEKIEKEKNSFHKADKYLGAKFRAQMKDLMNELNSCDAHFIRCIKPNEEKKKNFFVSSLALNQIRYLGILDSIKVRKESYPIRISYKSFFIRFKELAENMKGFKEDDELDFQDLSKKIVTQAAPEFDSKLILYGKTRIFLKIQGNSFLEAALIQRFKHKNMLAIRIQRTFRYMKKRAQLKIIFHSIKRIQTLFRVRSEYKKFRKKQTSLRKIQKWYHHVLFKRKLAAFFKILSKKRFCSTRIASLFRKNQMVKKFLREMKLIKKLQRNILLWLGRKKRKIFKFCKLLALAGVENAWKVVRKKFEADSACFVQKIWRGALCRNKFRSECNILKQTRYKRAVAKAAALISKIGKGHIVRSRKRQKKQAAFKIQGFVKMKWLRALFLEVRSATLQIQALAKKWLNYRHTMKEKWFYFKQTQIDSFELMKNKEFKILLGDDKFNANTFNDDFNDSKSSFLKNKPKKKSPLKIGEINNEEEFLRYMDDQNDSKNEERTLNGHETIFDDEKIVDFLAYNKNEQKNSPRLAHSQEFDLSGRKIILFPLILDFDLLGDISDLYPHNWSSYYKNVHDLLLEQEEFIQLIEVGESFTMAGSDSASIYSWGSNEFNELARNEGGDIGKIELQTKYQAQKIILGDSHGFILDVKRNLYCWGDNSKGQLGIGSNKILNDPVMHPLVPEEKVKDLKSKGNYNLCLLDDGKVLFWPFIKSNGIAIYRPIELPLQVEIDQISCGNNFAVLLSVGGLLYTFGRSNEHGQLGQGDTSPRSIPVLISSLKNQKEMIKSISCGFKHTIAKTGIGKVFVWGGGDCGQMGEGELKDELLPKMINIDRLTSLKVKPVQVIAGFRCNIMLMENGTMFWWGTTSKLKNVTTPIEIDYLRQIKTEQEYKEKSNDFIPIRLLSSWSRTICIISATIADTRLLDKTNNLFQTRKLCNTLTSYWNDQTIDPPFIDSITRHFTFKALKKVVFRRPAFPSRKSPSPMLSPHSKKLSKEEKESALKLFSKINPLSKTNDFITPNRIRSDLFEKNKKEKLRSLKEKIIEILKKEKYTWSEEERELMNLLNDPNVRSLMKNI